MKRLLSMAALITLAGCAAPTTEMVACPPQGCSALDPPSPMQQLLLAHAARDLACAAPELTVHELDDTSSAVSGCGKSARYVWIDEESGRRAGCSTRP